MKYLDLKHAAIIPLCVLALFATAAVAQAPTSTIVVHGDRFAELGPAAGWALRLGADLLNAYGIPALGAFVAWLYARITGRNLEAKHREAFQTAAANLGAILFARAVRSLPKSVNVDVGAVLLADIIEAMPIDDLVHEFKDIRAPEAVARFKVSDQTLVGTIRAAAAKGLPAAIAAGAAAASVAPVITGAVQGAISDR